MLGLLWNLAHSEDVPTDIMDLALSAHIKILDYSCSQVIYTSSSNWLLKNSKPNEVMDTVQFMQFQIKPE